MKKYDELRKKAQEIVFTILKKYNMQNFLKGSWKVGDFHLDLTGKTSFSDIDLLVEGMNIKKSKRIARLIMQETLAFFSTPLTTSIHTTISLDKMSMNDSNLLKIGEYITKYREHISLNRSSLDYIRAKITLLILWQTKNESYTDIVNRIGTVEARHALHVKFGIETIFSEQYAEKLIKSNGNNVALEFLDHCLLENPNDNFIQSIIQRLSCSETIDQWLQGYMIEKMCRY